MTYRKFFSIHLLLFLLVAVFSAAPWPYLMLTMAQLLFVPLTLRLILITEDWFAKHYFYFAIPAYTAVTILQITEQTAWDGLLAIIYLFFTISVAVYGITRFLQRGFIHLEEFAIDIGLIYLAIGGAWFFAHINNIETGFSPLITWLTGIHFHYSAFLLPIFVGFLGRIYKSASYKLICTIILLSPMIVAAGITFSRWLELLSVIIYIIGICGLIILSFHSVRNWLIRLSFAALGVTITFSFLYALGNVWGIFSVSLDFMLLFHGVLNCLVFALFGIIGWSLSPPTSKMNGWHFPISKIRGKEVIGEQILTDKIDLNKQPAYHGLIDSINIYESSINHKTLSPLIIDFYENTSNYRLFAEVRWSAWFKPFATIYRLISRTIQQLNLPLSDRKVEMTGNIYALQDAIDGRLGARAWVRKINGEVTFIALYSAHQHNKQTYMNIALPLPWSSMIGILELAQIDKGLRLTSKRISSENSDAGIYLASGKHCLMKLPLEEVFLVEEANDGMLKAQHTMWIFSIPFLTIDYSIDRAHLGRVDP